MDVLKEMEDVLGSDFEGPSADSDARGSFDSDDGEGGSFDERDDISSDDNDGGEWSDGNTHDFSNKTY